MDTVLNGFRFVTRQVVDFALPPRCPGCGTATENDHRFCLACWTELSFLGEPCCERCGLPFAYEAEQGAECGACLAAPPSFDRMRSAVAYGEIARTVALKLKYGGKPGVAKTLARFMERHLPADSAESILVPVPLHRWRIWTRGYNQSALIASALSARSGIRAELDALRRVKATPVLRGLGRRERAVAVRGAFRVPVNGRERIEDKNVILVDDVYTSGATANACAKELKKAGAASVNIICWARVVIGDD